MKKKIELLKYVDWLQNKYLDENISFNLKKKIIDAFDECHKEGIETGKTIEKYGTDNGVE